MKKLTRTTLDPWRSYLLARLQIVASIILVLGAVESVYAAEFFCSSGDVTCLITAINDANGTPGSHTITLEPGIYTLRMVDNMADGPNGLPLITGSIQIRASADDTPTVITRDPGAQVFRIFDVSVGGDLSLEGVTVQRGNGFGQQRVGTGILNRGVTSLRDSIVGDSLGQQGGGIYNIGTLHLSRSVISDNSGFFDGGGIHNEPGGVALVEDTTIARNGSGGGGILNRGSLTLRNSSIVSNTATGSGGGIENSGSLEISNTTIARNKNLVTSGSGGGIANGPTGLATIINSTIRENQLDPLDAFPGGGISNGGTLQIQNTIVAGNGIGPRSTGPDCDGIIMSLGNNLVGDPSGCEINLQPTDFTRDPGLGALVGTEEDPLPGRSFYPVLEGSPVIDKGNPDACPQTDQLGNPRVGICDIGAIEFYPLINNLVSVGNITTAFDPTPLSNAPAGTFSITAEFINRSAESIFHHFAEVSEITGGDLLLNADGGAGGAGAQLTPAQSPDSSLAPGASETVQFTIGLQVRDPFTFLVNMRGDAR